MHSQADGMGPDLSQEHLHSISSVILMSRIVMFEVLLSPPQEAPGRVYRLQCENNCQEQEFSLGAVCSSSERNLNTDG